MSRTAHRHFLSSLRSPTRVYLNATARSPRAALTRRMVSSQSHGSHGSTQSDRAWMIGSALVFGPLFLYLVSPSARKSSHGHENHHGEHEDKRQHAVPPSEENVNPVTDDEGTAVSGQEVKDSMEKAFVADIPKDAQAREVVGEADTETTTAEESSTDPQAESSADATPIPESEPNSTVVPEGVDAGESTTNATDDERAESVVSDANEGTVESKA